MNSSLLAPAAERHSRLRPCGPMASRGRVHGPYAEREPARRQRQSAARTGMNWEAKRVPLQSANTAPKTHAFPTKYQRQFSGAIEPVLHRKPRRGHDSDHDRRCRWLRSQRRAAVDGRQSRDRAVLHEGAMPGDTLTVKFRRIRLNRDTAVSGDRIVGSALTPTTIGTRSSTTSSTAIGRSIARAARPRWPSQPSG